VEVDAVVDRGLAGADLMLRHLVEQGSRHIGVIRSEESFSLSTALSTLVTSPELLGDARVILTSALADLGEEGGYVASAALLRDHPEVDAIYAPLDAFAVGAALAAREAGRRIPEDLLLATNYDGLRAANAEPPLTALALDLPTMARAAADLLMRVLIDGHAEDVQAPPPSLITRRSTSAIVRA